MASVLLDEFPALLPCPFGWPEVAGVHVGGCVNAAWQWPADVQAHAHNQHQDEYRGVVCVPALPVLFTRTGRPSRIAWHERAHLLCPNHGHDDRWRTVMREFGQPIPDRYRKRTRP